jgi:hypothetical protein
MNLQKKGKSNVIEIIFLNYLLPILLIRIATVGFQGDTGDNGITGYRGYRDTGYNGYLGYRITGDTGISQHDFCMRTVTDVNRFPLNVRNFTPKFRTRTTEGNNPANYL